MEKKELQVEVKQKIWFEAEKYTEDKVKAINEEHFNVYNAYISGATAYATKWFHCFEENGKLATTIADNIDKIKVLEYDNNKLKGEVEGLRTAGDEASGYIEFLDVQNNRLRKMLSDICEKAGAGTEIEKMIVEFFKDINTERESAAGREDACDFAEWLYKNRWFSFENNKWYYTFEQGTSMSDKQYQKEYVKTTAELYTIFKQQKEK